MKKIFSILIPVLLFVPFTVFARTPNRRHQPTPPPTPPPVVATSSIPWGAFTGNTKPLGSYQAFFIGEGDSFTQSAKGFTEPLIVYYESSLTAKQIVAGKADPSLTEWATQMKLYPHPIIFDSLDEMNGSWNPYSGNPAEYILAYRHVRNLFSDSNVQFAYDPNVAFPGVPVSTFTSYYPGDDYVDVVGLDGFDFGGQTFAQVFQPSLADIKTDFPAKPLWILSTGSVEDQPQWISDEFTAAQTYGVQGVIFFDYDQASGQDFLLTSVALSTLQKI